MKALLIRLIRWYQRRISPARPPCCRFIPTCSQYAIEALEYYGLWRGSLKAIWRILRCNPLSKGGYDPVRPDERPPRAESPIPRGMTGEEEEKS